VGAEDKKPPSLLDKSLDYPQPLEYGLPAHVPVPKSEGKQAHEIVKELVEKYGLDPSASETFPASKVHSLVLSTKGFEALKKALDKYYEQTPPGPFLLDSDGKFKPVPEKHPFDGVEVVVNEALAPDTWYVLPTTPPPPPPPVTMLPAPQPLTGTDAWTFDKALWKFDFGIVSSNAHVVIPQVDIPLTYSGTFKQHRVESTFEEQVYEFVTMQARTKMSDPYATPDLTPDQQVFLERVKPPDG
jgi:hypothetical protein